MGIIHEEAEVKRDRHRQTERRREVKSERQREKGRGRGRGGDRNRQIETPFCGIHRRQSIFVVEMPRSGDLSMGSEWVHSAT